MTIVSAEEQRAVYIPAELVRSEHVVLQQPPESGWLEVDALSDLRRELRTLEKGAGDQQRTAIEDASALVDYCLESGQGSIAVLWGDVLNHPSAGH